MKRKVFSQNVIKHIIRTVVYILPFVTPPFHRYKQTPLKKSYIKVKVLKHIKTEVLMLTFLYMCGLVEFTHV